jgi:hypothetical protein
MAGSDGVAAEYEAWFARNGPSGKHPRLKMKMYLQMVERELSDAEKEEHGCG